MRTFAQSHFDLGTDAMCSPAELAGAASWHGTPVTFTRLTDMRLFGWANDLELPGI